MRKSNIFLLCLATLQMLKSATPSRLWQWHDCSIMLGTENADSAGLTRVPEAELNFLLSFLSTHISSTPFCLQVFLELSLARNQEQDAL